MKHAGPVFLLLVGLLSMVGHFSGISALSGLGAATAASPAPKVFSSVDGLETYSTRFYLEWRTSAGAQKSIELDRKTYQRLRGPYNRRNVFGAVLAFGPILMTRPATQKMHHAVMQHSACGQRPLLRELGIDPSDVAGGVQVRLAPLPGTNIGDLPAVLKVRCP